PQVIVVKRGGNGCLLSVLITLLFGWVGLAAVALVAGTKLAWRVTAATVRGLWGMTAGLSKLTARGTVAAGRGSVALGRFGLPHVQRGVAAFTARYGQRGWLLVGGGAAGVVVVVVIMAALVR
ncbi:MAG TPA: hypothetical protein VGR57_09420, partial [Ktedonobacterales bacterium]|nr:hypothetical protein [Ktedonobacterales bacterium]